MLRLAEYDSGDYLDSVLADFSYAARQKGLDFSYRIEPGLNDIWIDREKMDLIIHNILSNSVKYTSEGFIKVLAKSERRSWTLEISDSGIGIPADFQSRIFRGSYRADNARECDESGYGIGLMITRQLVGQHPRGDFIFKRRGRRDHVHPVVPEEVQGIGFRGVPQGG